MYSQQYYEDCHHFKALRSVFVRRIVFCFKGMLCLRPGDNGLRVANSVEEENEREAEIVLLALFHVPEISQKNKIVIHKPVPHQV
jgi:hypothetical protein